MMRIALFFLLTTLAGAASAYSPTVAYCWRFGFQGSACYASHAASATAASISGVVMCNAFDITTTEALYTQYSLGSCPAPGTGGGSVYATQRYSGDMSCPYGGTLTSPGVCVCGAGTTDSGTACVSDTPACPAGQYRESGTCTPICGSAGSAWSGADVPGRGPSESDAGISYPSGKTTVCIATRRNGDDGLADDVCRVKPTGQIVVCADSGAGIECFSETARYTGERCSPSPANDLPLSDPTECSEGELWCKNTTGSCAAGFSGGVFNGVPICTKSGEPVNMVPRPQSPLAPPVPGDVTTPPGTTNAPGESNNPNTSTTVGVGQGATGVGAGAGGTGGNGNGEDPLTCGLPDTPKCKIDETGTPTGEGFDAAAIESVNTEYGKATTKLDQILAGEGAPDRSWGFGISFPTTCTPFTLGTARWGYFTLDFCQWQPVVHDLMSLIWVGMSVFLCIGMAMRTATGVG